MPLSYITEEAFLREIKKQKGANHKPYCFILGAGASISSEIPSGQKLAENWLQEIKDTLFELPVICNKEQVFAEEIDRRICKLEKMSNKNLKTRYDRFRSISYIPNTYETIDDYSCICELRFEGDKQVENKYIRTLMKDKTPYIGYFALASIISQTKNDRIITLNFDELTETALKDYTTCDYGVIAHEDTAYFADETITDKPKILKVHRDYNTGCFNTNDLLQELNPKWIEPLNRIFENYTPIVIGYAGTDHTLMSYLENRRFDNMYWCHMYGELPNDRVRKLIEKNGGQCVEIFEFDHVVLNLADILCKKRGFSRMIVGESFGKNATGYFVYNPKKALNSLRRSIKNRKRKENEIYELYSRNFKKKESEIQLSSMIIVESGVITSKFGYHNLAADFFDLAAMNEKMRGEYYGLAELYKAIELKKSGSRKQAQIILEELINKPYLRDQGWRFIKDKAMYHYIDCLLALDGTEAKEKANEYLGYRRCDGTFYRLLSLAELKLGELDLAHEHILHAIELHKAENNKQNFKGDTIAKKLIERAINESVKSN